jgi:hypothetical protein
MVELVTISIACYGTKSAKDKAVEAGKDPEAKFEAPIVDLSTVSDSTTIDEVARAFLSAYGVASPKESDPVSWFLRRCNKHLQDSHRASFHTTKASPLQKQIAASLKSYSPAELVALQKLMAERRA